MRRITNIEDTATARHEQTPAMSKKNIAGTDTLGSCAAREGLPKTEPPPNIAKNRLCVTTTAYHQRSLAVLMVARCLDCLALVLTRCRLVGPVTKLF
jgi:hypothetical protein